MAHQPDHSVIETVVQLLCESGMDRMAEVVRRMLNEAMRLERSQILEAAPDERSEKRLGYANGYKPKTVATRLGPLTVQVPQVRGDVAFYPSALERGVRSERALKLAVAEMYVQAVSTRKVTDIMEQLCGFEVSSTQVNAPSSEGDGFRSRAESPVPARGRQDVCHAQRPSGDGLNRLLGNLRPPLCSDWQCTRRGLRLLHGPNCSQSSPGPTGGAPRTPYAGAQIRPSGGLRFYPLAMAPVDGWSPGAESTQTNARGPC